RHHRRHRAIHAGDAGPGASVLRGDRARTRRRGEAVGGAGGGMTGPTDAASFSLRIVELPRVLTILLLSDKGPDQAGEHMVSMRRMRRKELRTAAKRRRKAYNHHKPKRKRRRF